MKKILKRIIAGMLIILILIIMLPAFGLMQPKYFLCVVSSNSMYPTLQPGSVVFLSKSSENSLEIGNIVVFRNEAIFGKKNVIHRVIEISPDQNYVLTKGDNNSWEDGYTAISDVKYKAVGIYDGFAKIYQFLHLNLLANSSLARTIILIFSTIYFTYLIIYILKNLVKEA